LARWRDKRDGEAIGELLKWQRHKAFSIARRILGQSADAEDAVQQAFVKLLSRTHGFDSADDFKAAVCLATVQCSINVLQSRRAINRKAAMLKNSSPFESQPCLVAENAEALEALRVELRELTADERAMLALCCEEGLSITAAASALGV